MRLLLHTLAHLCTEACHAVGARAGLRETLRQQPGGQAVVGGGQRAVVLQQVPRAAALPMVQAARRGEGVGGTKVSDMRGGARALARVEAMLHTSL